MATKAERPEVGHHQGQVRTLLYWDDVVVVNVVLRPTSYAGFPKHLLGLSPEPPPFRAMVELVAGWPLIPLIVLVDLALVCRAVPLIRRHQGRAGLFSAGFIGLEWHDLLSATAKQVTSRP